MLDKDVAYKNIIMKIEHEAIQRSVQPTLPEGYSFRFFTAGDETEWARIETSVLEFDAVDDALDYFKREFLPHIELLQERCVFVVDADGMPIATATAWFANSEEYGRQASLNWVAVCPKHQGKGIGKAVMLKVLQVFYDLEPNLAVWLHTQTWSHVAANMYLRLGFKMVKDDRLAKSFESAFYANDYDEAIEILSGIGYKL
ncbi:MAG: GNAT family N-acetyltransferase [Defluviitaleaceae bacterium]|nr:GNAT family N-acetyltransferase [Defluviitaleaceae bacterium]